MRPLLLWMLIAAVGCAARAPEPAPLARSATVVEVEFTPDSEALPLWSVQETPSASEEDVATADHVVAVGDEQSDSWFWTRRPLPSRPASEHRAWEEIQERERAASIAAAEATYLRSLQLRLRFCLERAFRMGSVSFDPATFDADLVRCSCRSFCQVVPRWTAGEGIGTVISPSDAPSDEPRQCPGDAILGLAFSVDEAGRVDQCWIRNNQTPAFSCQELLSPAQVGAR